MTSNTEFLYGVSKYKDRLKIFERYTKNWVNISGHSHEVKGIWDKDNGLKAGLPCFSCMVLNVELGNFKHDESIDLRHLEGAR